MTGNWSVYYCVFMFSFAMDYRQKREVRSNLCACVPILIIRVRINCNLISLITNFNSFYWKELTGYWNCFLWHDNYFSGQL